MVRLDPMPGWHLEVKEPRKFHVEVQGAIQCDVPLACTSSVST